MPARAKERRAPKQEHGRTHRKLQLIAVLLALVGVLLTIAIVSYSRLDEMNADLGLFGALTNPEKLERTQNWIGPVGAVLADAFIKGGIGYFSLVIPLLLLVWGWGILREWQLRRFFALSAYFLAIACLSSAIVGMIWNIAGQAFIPQEWSGTIGIFSALVFSRLLGAIGGSIVLGTALFLVFFLAYDLDMTRTAERLRRIYDRIADRVSAFRHAPVDASAERRLHSARVEIRKDEEPDTAVKQEIPEKPQPERVKPSRTYPPVEAEPLETMFDREDGTDQLPPLEPKSRPLNVMKRMLAAEEEAPAKAAAAVVAPDAEEEIDYVPPTVDLLDPSTQNEVVNDDELKENADLLQAKLANFSVEIESVSVTPGPVVTLYELVPASDVKISRITSLADDLALALKARGIRIIAPMPGKGTIGVEIPNAHPAIVRFRSVVNSTRFRETRATLPLAMGKTISGEVYVDDLAKMPHLLIAGATGSGKSVGINTILMSLVYKLHPSDVKFIIIDPKKIELSQYAKLRSHFLALSPDADEEIFTTPANAVAVLKGLELEMERRYDRLASAGVRSIGDYNDRFREGRLHDTEEIKHHKLPYLIVVIDELADLMITAAKEVEEPIARLAQLARAVGIHLVVATQRPSVDVLTGVIKANFPARIAYQVASKTDSRTILDMNGAEQLLGNGDMLYLPSSSPKPMRIQNAFLSTDEVERIVDSIARQKGYSNPAALPSVAERKMNGLGGGKGSRDELFKEAARLVVRHQQGSVSLVQRRLKVGYSRAARLIDELEMAGIVGPFDGSKARLVLVDTEDELERILEALEGE
ncbi:MAG: cell division protein FtsK [Ignavibacteriales bacterium CG07_land_8_20_14_0_80_59_12]|nr:MAG: cell division protein FtsK [Ignavibacteriales bacterium CG07_land_8_20_14_0_80_59_12]